MQFSAILLLEKPFSVTVSQIESELKRLAPGATLYQPSKALTLFCNATAAVILFRLTELIREVGDGRGGQAKAGFWGGRTAALCNKGQRRRASPSAVGAGGGS